jgi:hypothetical protein
MAAYCCRPEPRPQPLYFAECHYGKLGTEFEALDRDKNSRAEIVRQIRNGGINPVKILEVDEVAGTCRDCTDELMAEAAESREPRSLHASAEALRQILIDHDRDTRKHGSIFGW